MPWSSTLTPLNPALKAVDGWNKSNEKGFKAGFKKHALSRVVTPAAVAALGSVSFVYNAGSIALKAPVTMAKYTVLLIIPVKVNGRWCSAGSCVPSEFGAKEMCKHGLKAVAFLVEVVVCPALSVASPSFVVWLNVKCRLVNFRESQESQTLPVAEEKPQVNRPRFRRRPPVADPAALRGSLLDELRAARQSDLRSASARVLAPRPETPSTLRSSLFDEIRSSAQEVDEGTGTAVSTVVNPLLLRRVELTDHEIDVRFKRFFETFMSDRATSEWSSRAAVSRRQHLQDEYHGIHDSINSEEVDLSDDQILEMVQSWLDITAELESREEAFAYIQGQERGQRFIDRNLDEVEELAWRALENERVSPDRLAQFRAQYPHGMPAS